MTTTAVPEYCSLCGRQLGAIRTIIVGSNVTLHPDCVQAWRWRNVVPPITDTSNTSWPVHQPKVPANAGGER